MGGEGLNPLSFQSHGVPVVHSLGSWLLRELRRTFPSLGSALPLQVGT